MSQVNRNKLLLKNSLKENILNPDPTVYNKAGINVEFGRYANKSNASKVELGNELAAQFVLEKTRGEILGKLKEAESNKLQILKEFYNKNFNEIKAEADERVTSLFKEKQAVYRKNTGKELNEEDFKKLQLSEVLNEMVSEDPDYMNIQNSIVELIGQETECVLRIKNTEENIKKYQEEYRTEKNKIDGYLEKAKNYVKTNTDTDVNVEEIDAMQGAVKEHSANMDEMISTSKTRIQAFEEANDKKKQEMIEKINQEWSSKFGFDKIDLKYIFISMFLGEEESKKYLKDKTARKAEQRLSSKDETYIEFKELIEKSKKQIDDMLKNQLAIVKAELFGNERKSGLFAEGAKKALETMQQKNTTGVAIISNMQNENKFTRVGSYNSYPSQIGRANSISLGG